MAVAPQAFSDTLLIGESNTFEFTVSNTETTPSVLNFTISGGTANISANPTSGSVASAESELITLTLDTNGQTAGDYVAEFIVSGDDPNNASDTVTVNWTLNDPPVVGANPDTFDVTLATWRLNRADLNDYQLWKRSTGFLKIAFEESNHQASSS